ncbi:hypothetical protein EV2_006574 [Malus domestica]
MQYPQFMHIMPHVMNNVLSMMNMPSSQLPVSMNASSSYTMPSMPSSSSNSASPQVWLTDSGAINHLTNDLNNLSLASPYPQNETVQTANGKGLSITHFGHSILKTPVQSIKLNFDKATGRLIYKGLYNNELYPIPFVPVLSPAAQKQAYPAIAYLRHTVKTTI